MLLCKVLGWSVINDEPVVTAAGLQQIEIGD